MSDIFTVVLKGHNIQEFYIFIGEVNKSIRIILSKIETNINISSNDKTNIQKICGSQLNFILNNKKLTKLKIKFIYNKIFSDDKIKVIMNKIFVYISNTKKKRYLTEKLQQLWIKTTNNKYVILGHHYLNHDGDITPSSIHNSNNLVNSRFIDTHTQFHQSNKHVSNTNAILSDVIPVTAITDKIIFVNHFILDYNYFMNNTITINNEIENGYFKVHYPMWNKASYTEYNKNITIHNKKIDKSKDVYEQSYKIYNYVKTFNKIDSNLFSPSYITHCSFIINTNINQPDFIDLMKLFRLITLSKGLPFISYKDSDMDTPIYAVYKNINNIHNRKVLQQWIDANTEDTLTLKYNINTSDKPIYSSIKIKSNGELFIWCVFDHEQHATINNIKTLTTNINTLIDSININDNYKINRKRFKNTNIDRIQFNIEGGNMVIGENTQLKFFNSHIELIQNNIDINEFNEFIEYFKGYFIFNIELHTELDKISFRYLRISNFEYMEHEFLFISTMYENNIRDEYEITNAIVTKFDKTTEDATAIFTRWKHKTRFNEQSEKHKLYYSNNPGSLIQIKNNKIFMKGLNISKYNYITSFIKIILSIYLNPVIKAEFINVISNANFQSSNTNNNDINNGFFLNNSNEHQLIHINNNNNNKLPNTIDNNKYKNQTDERKYSKSNVKTHVGKDNLLKCKLSKINLKADTCDDVCEDTSYKLRRLQMHDPILFNTKYNKLTRLQNSNKQINKKDAYSKKCQGKQPIVLDYDPNVLRKGTSNNITESDITSGKYIHKNAYTYSIKYGSNPDKQYHFICPKIWCPYCEIPIYENEPGVQESIKYKSFSKSRNKCKVIKCPRCKKEVTMEQNEEYSQHKDKDGYSHGSYPGFISQDKHPTKQFCMPCCYKKRHNDPKSTFYKVYKSCMGEVANNDANNKSISYILQSTRFEPGRFSILPSILDTLFNPNQICEAGDNMRIGQKCFFQRGTMVKHNQSFLYIISQLLYPTEKDSLDIIKRDIIKKITPLIFKSLNNGMLEILFYNDDNIPPIDYFKQFIQSNDTYINDFYIWDLLSRPGILFENGINIFIFTYKSVICPTYIDKYQLYDLQRDSICIVKQDNSNYRPIMEYSLNKKPVVILNDTYTVLKKIYDIVLINCNTVFHPIWYKLLEDNIKTYKLDVLHPKIKEQSIRFIKKQLNNTSFSIKSQYIDNYNKTIGIILNNNIFIPVAPIGLLTNITISSNIPLLQVKTVLKTLLSIADKTDIKCKPVRKILNSNNKIIALLIETGRIIPVLESNNTIQLDTINIKYYSNADNIIKQQLQSTNNRVTIVNKYLFEKETLARLEFEISKILYDNKLQFDYVINLINSSNTLEDKRTKLSKYLQQITKKIITTTNPSFNIDKYIKPNIRIQCSKNNKCNLDPHCVYTKTKCKLFISKLNLETGKNNIYLYYLQIADSLIRNLTKREQILSNSISNIIKLDTFENKQNRLIIYGKSSFNKTATDNLTNQFNALYKIKTKFDFQNPEHYNVKEPIFKQMDMNTHINLNENNDIKHLSFLKKKANLSKHNIKKIRIKKKSKTPTVKQIRIKKKSKTPPVKKKSFFNILF
jgi:hypothetical protein